MNIAIFGSKRIGRKALSFITKNYNDDLKLIVFENKNCPLFSEFGHLKPYLFKEDIYKKIDYISSLDLDWIILAWWHQMLKQEIIDIPKFGIINTHNSLLPFNRGVHSNFWSIVEEKEYGVSIHLVEKGVDDGDIISQVKIPYDWTTNGGQLYELGMEALEKLFEDTYVKLRKNEFITTPQNHKLMTVHKSNEIENKSNIKLDDDYKARDLINIMRAKNFPKKSGARFVDKGNVYEIRLDIKLIGKKDDTY